MEYQIYFIMKSVFFALAFLLIGTFAFANTAKEIKIENNHQKEVVLKTETNATISTKVEVFILFDRIRCTRTCFYQGGELLGCTAWECEVIIELDEVIITA